MPRRNRVDPWGDLHADEARGLFTGNRGCVVDSNERVVRHHGSMLWIICRTSFRGWRWPLARPRRWTPLFFLDDAVALAAGHRPCGLCRRVDYQAYRDAVGRALQAQQPLLATALNARLRAERLRSGRGLVRAQDRILWSAPWPDLPDGVVVVDPTHGACLLHGRRLWRFSFSAWVAVADAATSGRARVLTPPTSVAALRHGFQPVLHSSVEAAV